MKSVRVFSYLLAGLWMTMAGCSGGSSGPVQVENLCEEYRQAICGFMSRCKQEWLYELATHRSCEQLVDCSETGLSQAVVSVEEGRMSYDAELADKCLDDIRNAPCGPIDSVFAAIGPECEDVFSGLVEEGGSCYFDNECQDGFFCNEDTANCPGQCAAYQPIGGECGTLGNLCDPDVADCDYSTQKCVPLAGEGESCEQVPCKEGLVCAGETGSMTCRQPVAAGGDCLNMDECQAGLICSQGKCIEHGGSGESCYVGSEMTLALFACKPGLYCDADIIQQQTTGTCKPQKAAGQQCIMFYECTPGLVCKGVKLDQMSGQVTPGQCATPQQEGQPCDTELGLPECDWDLYCDEDSGTCKPVPGPGDACVYDGNPDCVGDDLYCDSLQQGVEGTCQKKKDTGSSCTSGEECLSDYCDQGTCQETDCIPPGS